VADVFYPQCWIRLQLRFEDYISVPPPLPQPTFDGDPVDQGGFVTLDKKIIPISAQVTLNSYRQADEARVTIPYGALPIDPRVLRQATVQIYAGTFENPQDFADGIGPISGESQLTLIPETGTYGLPAGEDIVLLEETSNEIFRGFIDDWEVSQDGGDTITISARDITAILIDTEMPIDGLAGIPASTPIDEVIKAVVVGDEQAQFLPVDAREQRAGRIDARRDVRRLTYQAGIVAKKLAQLSAQQPPSAEVTAEIARLTAKQSAIAANLTAATAQAAAADALPILAKRYGLPGMRGLEVVNATGEELPTIGELKGATWFDSKGNAKKARGGGAKEQISYWDFVTDLCVGVGLICYMRTPIETQGALGALPPAELVIDLPKTYYKESGQELRRFAYGDNVDSLSVVRNYNGRNVPTGVAVTATEAKTGRSITSRFPELPLTTKAGANPLGTGDRAEYKTVVLQDRIPSDRAQEVLDRIAESLYEQFGRKEMEIKVSTTSLNAFPSNRGTGTPDMLQLRAGDPVEIVIVPSLPDNVENTYVTQAGNFWKLSTPERIEALITTYDFDPVIAAQLALAMESDLLQTVFYVREVAVDFQYDSGFKFDIQAINFLDARYALIRQSVDFLPAAVELAEVFLPVIEDL